MSLDYNHVTSAIVAWLRAMPLPDGIDAVEVREEPDFDEHVAFQGGPYIDVTLDERVVTQDLQRISAGSRVNMYLAYSIWVMTFDAFNRADAVRVRNIIMSAVESRLMQDPRFGNLCEQSWQEGGPTAYEKREIWGTIGQIRLVLRMTQT